VLQRGGDEWGKREIVVQVFQRGGGGREQKRIIGEGGDEYCLEGMLGRES
jgi:hypothetical protein